MPKLEHPYLFLFASLLLFAVCLTVCWNSETLLRAASSASVIIPSTTEPASTWMHRNAKMCSFSSRDSKKKLVFTSLSAICGLSNPSSRTVSLTRYSRSSSVKVNESSWHA